MHIRLVRALVAGLLVAPRQGRGQVRSLGAVAAAIVMPGLALLSVRQYPQVVRR